MLRSELKARVSKHGAEAHPSRRALAGAPQDEAEDGAGTSPHHLPVRVYWEDTDAGGLVYHASYLRFLERGRTEMLRALGIDQGTLLAESGLAFVVRRMAIEFHRPARLDDLVTVETVPSAVGGASLVLGQAIRRGGDLLVEATVTCACLRNGRAARMPPMVRNALRS
jgi:acyl-CoA thioester hydrolase